MTVLICFRALVVPYSRLLARPYSKVVTEKLHVTIADVMEESSYKKDETTIGFIFSTLA